MEYERKLKRKLSTEPDMTLTKAVCITAFIFLVTACAGALAVNDVALNARAIITVTSTTTGPATTVAVTAQPTSTTPPMKTETPNSALSVTTSSWIYLVAATITWVLR
ncbi:hypothetical protein BC943DRAFT_42660 [Umbelopsis sp. AD052]|nr:hypothetical protein BC943DRAFT_42660 [Umbelopsis sp. AD052]